MLDDTSVLDSWAFRNKTETELASACNQAHVASLYSDMPRDEENDSPIRAAAFRQRALVYPAIILGFLQVRRRFR